MQDFNSICAKCNSINFAITYKWRDTENTITLRDILPKNFCVLAFHSMYAYLKTFYTGGWFNWVNYGEHVIVNCASPEGIAMYIKAPTKGSPNLIEVEVMNRNDKCYKGYSLKDSFLFNFEDENRLKFKILDRLIPFMFDKEKKNGGADEFFCNIDGEKIHCRVEFEKDKQKSQDSNRL